MYTYKPQGGSGRTGRVGYPQKRFNPSLNSGSQGQTVWSTPSIVPPPNQTKVHYDSLSVATIMSMSVSNVDGSRFSN